MYEGRYESNAFYFFSKTTYNYSYNKIRQLQYLFLVTTQSNDAPYEYNLISGTNWGKQQMDIINMAGLKTEIHIWQILNTTQNV